MTGFAIFLSEISGFPIFYAEISGFVLFSSDISGFENLFRSPIFLYFASEISGFLTFSSEISGFFTFSSDISGLLNRRKERPNRLLQMIYYTIRESDVPSITVHRVFQCDQIIRNEL